MSKESQLKKQQEQAVKDRLAKQKAYEEKATAFFQEYTDLTDKYGLFLNAKLEYSTEGVRPKVTVEIKPPKKEDVAAKDATPEPAPAA